MDGSSQLAQLQATVAAKHADFESRKRARLTSEDSNDNDNSRKAFYREFKKVVELADVIIQVLDARDPLSCRCPDVERYIRSTNPNKRIILLLNKIDLVPREVGEQWLKYLREELPTVAFKCSTQHQDKGLAQRHMPGINQAGRQRGRLHAARSGNNGNNQNNGGHHPHPSSGPDHANKDSVNASSSANAILSSSSCLGAETLLALLKNYTRHGAEGGGPALKAGITVGVVGLPNVGKSSLINSLKRARVAQVGNTPGVTKSVQEVVLDKHIKLLDSPGVVFASSSADGADAAAIALRNSVKVERLADPVTPVGEILKRVAIEKLAALYKLKDPNELAAKIVEAATAAASREGGGGGLEKIGQPEMDRMAEEKISSEDAAMTAANAAIANAAASFAAADCFLQRVALVRGKLRRGGTPDVVAAAKLVLQDWNDGRIPYFTLPPVRDNAAVYGGETAVVTGWAKEFDVDKVFEQEKQAVIAHLPSMAAAAAGAGGLAGDAMVMGETMVMGSGSPYIVREMDSSTLKGMNSMSGLSATPGLGAAMQTPQAYIAYQSAGTSKVDLRNEDTFMASTINAEKKKKKKEEEEEKVVEEEDDIEEDDEVAVLNAAIAAARKQAKAAAAAAAAATVDVDTAEKAEKEKGGNEKGGNNGRQGKNGNASKKNGKNKSEGKNNISNDDNRDGAKSKEQRASSAKAMSAGDRTEALMRSVLQAEAAHSSLYTEAGQYNPHTARAQRKKARKEGRS